jgi:hypothetical protein
MSVTDGPLRVTVATALTAGMAALWAGSMYHYGSAGDSAATMIADAQAFPEAQVVNAVSYLLETILFNIAAIGLAAIVRGRGRTFLLVACGVLAVGLPSHVMGATFHLTLHGLATSSVPTPLQVDVLETVQGVGSLYFLLVMPFLLGLVLLTAALWRAGVVSWVPFAVLGADTVLGMTVNGSHTPADWMWWVDPVVTIAAFAWIGLGVIRYRAADERAVEAATEAHPAELAVA